MFHAVAPLHRASLDESKPSALLKNIIDLIFAEIFAGWDEPDELLENPGIFLSENSLPCLVFCFWGVDSDSTQIRMYIWKNLDRNKNLDFGIRRLPENYLEKMSHAKPGSLHEPVYVALLHPPCREDVLTRSHQEDERSQGTFAQVQREQKVGLGRD